MSSFRLYAALIASALVLSGVQAEHHKVTLVNKCGTGTPLLKENGQTLLSGAGSKTFDGPLTDAIAFLQDAGSCGEEGEGCTLVETTLMNGASSTDILLIPPHKFSVGVSFRYTNAGCKGRGEQCASATCPTAIRNAGDIDKEVTCFGDNVNLRITFCP